MDTTMSFPTGMPWGSLSSETARRLSQLQAQIESLEEQVKSHQQRAVDQPLDVQLADIERRILKLWSRERQ